MSVWRRLTRGSRGERSVNVEGDVRDPVVTGDYNIVTVDRGNTPVFTLQPLAVVPAVPPDSGPAALLTARHELVEFTGREQDLQQLAGWLASAPRRAARLVTAPGGQGKTRFALHSARAAAMSGWRVLVARHRSDGALIPHEATELVPVPGEPVGTLIVVDYADRWPSEDLLHLFERPESDTGVVRSLLLGRSPAFWGSVAGILKNAGVTPSHHALGAGSGHQAGRDQMYVVAIARFARHLGVPQSSLPPRPDLRRIGFELTLAVHMAALVAVLTARDDPTSPPAGTARLTALLADPAALSRELLNREVRHWEHLARRDPKTVSPSPQEMARAVLVATLTRGLAVDTALELLADLPIGSTPVSVIDGHKLCYPPRDPSVVLEPLYPDRLGEDFIAAVLPGGPAENHETASPAHLTDNVAPAILNGLISRTITTVGITGGPARTVPHPLVGPVLTVLTETGRRWNHIARDYLCPTVQQLPHLLLWAGGGTIARLASIADLAPALPGVGYVLDAVIGAGSHLDLDIGAVAVSEQLVNEARKEADKPSLAGTLTTFGVRLASVGRRAEALTAAEEAARLYRELVQLNRDAYLPNLAMSVNNLANRLAEAGRRAEALTAAEEAARLYRELVQLNRDAYLPDLAMSVNNLAISLAEAGRRVEALTAAEEAVALYRELAAQSADLFGPRLDAAGELVTYLRAQPGADGA